MRRDAVADLIVVEESSILRRHLLPIEVHHHNPGRRLEQDTSTGTTCLCPTNPEYRAPSEAEFLTVFDITIEDLGSDYCMGSAEGVVDVVSFQI